MIGKVRSAPAYRGSHTLQAQAGADEYKPVTVDAETLRSLYRAEVFCCKPRQPGLRATYYKSAIPDVHIGVEIKILRRVLHAIDASPARWRGGAGSLFLDGARAAASSCTQLTG